MWKDISESCDSPESCNGHNCDSDNFYRADNTLACWEKVRYNLYHVYQLTIIYTKSQLSYYYVHTCIICERNLGHSENNDRKERTESVKKGQTGNSKKRHKNITWNRTMITSENPTNFGIVSC